MDDTYCTAEKRDGTFCSQIAIYRCSEGHFLCANHAVRLGGEEMRRKTDRKCTVCSSRKIEYLKAPATSHQRRRCEIPQA
jgi:hypothetical protein